MYEPELPKAVLNTAVIISIGVLLAWGVNWQVGLAGVLLGAYVRGYADD